MNEHWRHKKNVMGTKVMKTKGFPKYTKTKTNYKKIGLNLNPNTKHENKNIKT
jgi:hypothetical protein